MAMEPAQTGCWPDQTATVAGALDQPRDRYVKPGLDVQRSAAGDETVRSAQRNLPCWYCPQRSGSRPPPRLVRGQNPAGNSLERHAGWRASAPLWHRSPVRSSGIAKRPAHLAPLPLLVWLPIGEDVLWPAIYSFTFNLGERLAAISRLVSAPILASLD